MALMVLLGSVLLICVVAKRPTTLEPFVEKSRFIIKKGADVYDDFYVSAYDKLFYSEIRTRFEVGQIINAAGPTDAASILDVGSGTGHRVGALTSRGIAASGVDASRAMVSASRSKYPEATFHEGDATDTLTFPERAFTLVTCLYGTIYEIKERPRFFRNCAHWLMPGGRLMLHVVDLDKFDPIVPGAETIPYVGLQELGNERVTRSSVVFDTHKYDAEYKQSDGSVVFSEIWKCRDTGAVRKNERTVAKLPVEQIIQEAQSAGFIVDERHDLGDIGYEHQYLYVLSKPN